jgi:hypothetical protein
VPLAGDGQITVDELRQGVAQHGGELSESDLMQVGGTEAV